MQYNYINEEGLGVQEVGELVQCLGHSGPSRLWDVELSCDHDIIGTILRGQEEDAVGVGFVVKEGDPSLTQLIGVILHLDHQVCEIKNKKIAPRSFLISSLFSFVCSSSVSIIMLREAEKGELCQENNFSCERLFSITVTAKLLLVMMIT